MRIVCVSMALIIWDKGEQNTVISPSLTSLTDLIQVLRLFQKLTRQGMKQLLGRQVLLLATPCYSWHFVCRYHHVVFLQMTIIYVFILFFYQIFLISKAKNNAPLKTFKTESYHIYN